jgi:hypothetical protein
MKTANTAAPLPTVFYEGRFAFPHFRTGSGSVEIHKGYYVLHGREPVGDTPATLAGLHLRDCWRRTQCPP